MKSKLKKIDKSRRRLLYNAVGLGATGAGLATFGVAAARPTVDDVAQPKLQSGAYQETEHIRRYYRSAR